LTNLHDRRHGRTAHGIAPGRNPTRSTASLGQLVRCGAGACHLSGRMHTQIQRPGGKPAGRAAGVCLVRRSLFKAMPPTNEKPTLLATMWTLSSSTCTAGTAARTRDWPPSSARSRTMRRPAPTRAGLGAGPTFTRFQFRDESDGGSCNQSISPRYASACISEGW
jgi:hypothetical protein